MSEQIDPEGDSPLLPMESVGRDIAARAELRFYRPAAGTAEFRQKVADRRGRVDGSIECIVCHWFPRRGLSWRRSKVGGRDVAVCDRCAQLAVSVNDYHPDLRSCLVMLACEVERAAGGHDHGTGGAWQDVDGNIVATSGVLRRVRDTFPTGFYADECQCPAHLAARAKRERAFTPPPPDGSSPDVTDLPLSMIRSFQEKNLAFEGEIMDRKEVIAILSVRNASETAYPGVKPGGLADRAGKLATQASARQWTDAHAAERATGQAAFSINNRPERTRCEFDQVDVDQINRVLDRLHDDDSAYCDWCGVIDDTVANDGTSWCCADCARSSNLVGSRLNLLYGWLRAFRSGGRITFLDTEGKPCRR